MKSSIIYARVSTAAQNTDRQVADLTSFAEANGFIVEKTFTEKVSGAKKNTDRPELMAALSYAKSKGCTILVSELSRLGRNIDEVLKTIIDCKDSKINVYFQKEQVSIFNSDGKEHPFLMIMMATLGTCASIERENIRFRMKSGYEKFRADGGKVGRKEGYRYTLNEYEAKYPDLLNDLKDKQRGKATGKQYTVAMLAKRYGISPTTVQQMSNILKRA